MMTSRWIACLAMFWMVAAGGCGIGVQLCKVGLDCQPGQRCLEDRCQPPKADNNTPPIARISGQARVKLAGRVRLDGTSSSDADLDYITFKWTFTSRPEGSTAALENTEGRQAGFVADKAGTFVIKLTVTDALGAADDTEHTVQVNTAPVPDAGGDKLVVAGTNVELDASASRDADEDPLTYQWKLTGVPPGSKSQLQGAAQVKSSFKPDLQGNYTLSLTVSDGYDEATQELQIRAIRPEDVTPSLERLDPFQAPTRSIAKVNLFGNGFIQGAEVLFDDQPVGNVNYRSLSHIIVELNLKSATVGGHEIKLRNPGGKTTQAQLFQVDEVPIPVIASLSPNKGATNQTVEVKIKGTGFVIGAIVLFRGSPTPAKYIDHEELQVSLSLRSVPTGKYDVIVENDKGRRSQPSPFEVTQLLPEPIITRHILSPSTAVVGKKFTYLRLYGSNMTSTTQVLQNNKLYAGAAKVTMTSSTAGYIQLDNFSSEGLSAGSQSFQFRNSGPGQNLTSRTYSIQFSDPNEPSLYSSVTFYKKDVPTSSIGQTGKVYDYIQIRGKNLNGSIEVYIDGDLYKGQVVRQSTTQLQLPDFTTSSMTEGTHELYIKQSAGGKNYRSNTINFTLQNGEIPQIKSIRTSENTTQLLSDRIYTYIQVLGVNFYSGLEVIVDGATHKGNTHIENEGTLYIYQVDATNMQVGNHTLILRNNINGKTFSSKLFTFQVLDGNTPTITRVRFSPSTIVYPDEVYAATLTTTNVKQGALVLLDGKPYTGPANVSQNIVVLPTFESAGLSIGTHTFQLRNIIKGKDFNSNPISFAVRARPAPRLNSLNPPQIDKGKVTRVTINGTYLSQSTTLQLDGQLIKSTYISANALQIDIDGTQLKEGSHTLQAFNADGQKSNVLTFVITPDIGPTLWRLTPQEFQATGSAATPVSNLTLYGYRFVNGAQVLFDGKPIGNLQVTNTTGTYGRITLPAQLTAKAGEYKISVKNPDGKVSNHTELWVMGSNSPEIFQVSPPFLYDTSPSNLRVRGRGFEPTSSLLFNGTKVATTFQALTSNTYSAELRATLSVTDIQQAPNPSILTIVNPDGTKSTEYPIWKQSGGFYVSYVSPNYAVAGDTRIQNINVSGVGFTSSSKLYLNGKEIPAQLLSATRLSAQWQLDSTIKPGEYLKWEVKDAAKTSSPLSLYVGNGPLVTNINPPFISISQGSQTLTLTLNVSTTSASFELFGKTHQVTGNPYQAIIGPELANQKPGLYTFRLKTASGASGNTVGIHLIP